MRIVYDRGVYPVTIQVSETVGGEVVSWDYGDGSKTSSPNDIHQYAYPGIYILTALNISNNIVSQKKIIVDDTDVLAHGLGGNPDRRSYQWGNTSEQGFGWSENGEDSFVWPDTKASILKVYDDNEDLQIVVYDSYSGLPYTTNPRKGAIGSRIIDAWLDKIDLFRQVGYIIRNRVRLPEYVGEMNGYELEASDLSLFFLPIYKEKQGVEGYREDGLREGTKIDIELYLNNVLNLQASSFDVPMDVELYFDRKLQGSPIQLAFEINDSQYRFIKSEFYIEVYDKAKFPFKAGMKEKTYQTAIINTITKINKQPINKNNGTEVPATIEAGTIPLLVFDDDYSLPTGICYVTQKGTADIIYRGLTPLPVTVINEFQLDGNLTRIFKVNVINNDIIKETAEIYDIRVFSTSLLAEAEQYYIKDITTNNGRNIL